MKLTSKRRAYLRKRAHDLDALVRIGKDGVTDNLIQSILDYSNKAIVLVLQIFLGFSILILLPYLLGIA